MFNLFSIQELNKPFPRSPLISECIGNYSSYSTFGGVSTQSLMKIVTPSSTRSISPRSIWSTHHILIQTHATYPCEECNMMSHYTFQFPMALAYHTLHAEQIRFKGNLILGGMALSMVVEEDDTSTESSDEENIPIFFLSPSTLQVHVFPFLLNHHGDILFQDIFFCHKLLDQWQWYLSSLIPSLPWVLIQFQKNLFLLIKTCSRNLYFLLMRL